MFITTSTDLPAHEEQRRRTLTLITRFDSAGQSRLADQNRIVLEQLDARIAQIKEGLAGVTNGVRDAGDNTAALAEAARRRHDEALVRTRAVLRTFDATGDPITYAKIAGAAHVSRAWLYTQPDIRAAVDHLRNLNNRSGRTPHPDPAAHHRPGPDPQTRGRPSAKSGSEQGGDRAAGATRRRPWRAPRRPGRPLQHRVSGPTG